MNVTDEIEKEERDQALSIPAKRLREKLLPLKSKEEQTAKRWFWELLQNASDYNQEVDVRLEIDNNSVIFKHSGNPFSIRDVLNLISPDSGKDKDEVKKENIGKFGSGLVSTHILSSEINVSGAYRSEKEDKLFRFNIVLDRSSYENKESLINDIEKTKSSFREVHSLLEKSEYTGFMTSFSYNLKKRLPGLSSTLDVVSVGLEQIYEVLPYTLSFMMKVRSVEIEDKRTDVKIKDYTIRRISNGDSQQVFDLDIDHNRRTLTMTKLRHQNVETVYRHEEGTVCSLPKGISKLFCGLPMIGSEDMGLPFVLNSYDFEPTIEREGVEITPNDKQNMALFKQSILLYKILLDDVAKNELDNAFVLTQLSKKFNGVEGSKNIFKRDFLPEYQNIIEKSKIVRNANGDFVNFADVSLPYKEGKPFVELYYYGVEIRRASFPSKDSFEGWVSSTDFTLFPKQKFSLEQFVDEISQMNQIQVFSLSSGRNVIDWLKGIASIVNEVDETLFGKYAILPDQKGYLRKKKELSIDQDVPDSLKSILNKLSSDNIELTLLDKSFNEFSSVVENNFDLPDACFKIDSILKQKYSDSNGSTVGFDIPLNDLYKWISNSSLSKKELENLFVWFYPKRATLFMETFGDKERDYAFTIVQSGKIKALAALAASDITEEELAFIGNNPETLSKVFALMKSEIDDRVNASAETGDYGENLVYEDLRKKYKSTEGYDVIWAAKKGEPRFDFEVKERGKTKLYVDAKTTMRGISNSDSIPFFMRNSQWEFLPTISNDVKYVIARVFKKSQEIKYLQISTL